MKTQHSYALTVLWTGNLGTGTNSYRSYEQAYTIEIEGKPDIEGSSDPSFRGDKTKHNPEEMLLSALSSCHMLSYLHLCAVNGVIVTAYVDQASGTMVETPDGGGHFTQATVHPIVTVANSTMIEKASELCFIASSVNFPVRHEPVAVTDEPQGS